ncbi:hypothetical protein B0H14DRAFT_2782814 [Mycena olivaceomarginata]|nr:hypothetical protein B0H14DRAFT_2782814 [Mycena olivaceomarginata]
MIPMWSQLSFNPRPLSALRPTPSSPTWKISLPGHALSLRSISWGSTRNLMHQSPPSHHSVSPMKISSPSFLCPTLTPIHSFKTTGLTSTPWARLSSPQAEWPLLLPLPSSSPLESPAVILTTPSQPQPALRKHRRSVDPADIINESRARKLRVRTS